MEANFWLERWQRNEIGFHEAEVHPLLRNYWPTIIAAHANHTGNVFVPLCGKSLDMIWLIDQGLHVYGVELSTVGVEAFFNENNIPFEKSAAGEVQKYASENATIFAGDIFSLTKDMLPALDLFYDRAALVALPSFMRADYVAKVASLLVPDAHGLLVSLEYEDGLINPPPHSISVETVLATYGSHCRCDLLGSGAGDVKGKPCIEHAVHLRLK